MRGLRDLFRTRDSPFPAWLELRHPALARWRENAPYLAFRARRKDHAYPVLQRLGNLRTFWQILWMILAVPMLLVMLVCMFIWGCWGVVFPLAIMVVAAWLPRLMQRSNPSTIPWRLTDLYLRPRVYEQAILDFYLAANSGRDVAEGFCLEDLEERFEMLEIGVVVLVLLIPLVCFLLPDSVSAWGGIMVFSLMVTSVSAFLTLVDLKAVNGFRGRADLLFGLWKGSGGGAETAAGWVGGMLVFLLGSCVAFFFGFLSLCLQILLLDFAPLAVVGFVDDPRFVVVCTLWCMIYVSHAHRRYRLLPKRENENTEMDQANELYLVYIQGREERVNGGGD